MSSEFGVSAAEASLSISGPALGLAAAVLPWTAVADRFGRLPAMRVSLTAATILGLVVPLAPDFEWLVALRILDGIALAGVPGIAITYLTEEIHPSALSVAVAVYISGNGIGGSAGRVIAGPIAEFHGWRLSLVVVALLSSAAAAVFLLSVPRSRGFRRTPARPIDLARSILINLREPKLLVLYVQGFLLIGSFVAIFNYLPYRLQAEPYNLSLVFTSALFLTYFFGTVSSGVAGRAATRFGRARVLVVSMITMIMGIALTLATSLWAVIVGLIVVNIGMFAAHSICAGWTGVRAVGGRAQATSLYNVFYYGGASIIGGLGGLVFTLLGWLGLAVILGSLLLGGLAWVVVAERSDLRGGGTG